MTTRYLTDSGDLRHMTVPIALTENQLGGTAPTAATKGTTPTVQGFLFDAAGELIQLQVHIPDQYKPGTDIDINLYCVLNQEETIADVIDWTMDYVCVAPGTGLVSQTSTNKTSDTSITSGNISDGTLYKCEFTLVNDDSDNPLAKEALIIAEIHRTDLADCGGVILVEADAHIVPEF